MFGCWIVCEWNGTQGHQVTITVLLRVSGDALQRPGCICGATAALFAHDLLALRGAYRQSQGKAQCVLVGGTSAAAAALLPGGTCYERIARRRRRGCSVSAGSPNRRGSRPSSGLENQMRRYGLVVVIGLLASCDRASQVTTERRDANTPTTANPSAAQVAGAGSAGTAPAQPVVEPGFQFIEAVRVIRPSVVSFSSNRAARRVTGESPLEGTPLDVLLRARPLLRGAPEPRVIGSGIVLDDEGNILTNNHILEGADTTRVRFFDGHEAVANVVGTDPKTDLAVVRVSPTELQLQPAPFGDSDLLQVGQWVLACGSPPGSNITVSAGVISSIGRGSASWAENEDVIQTDATINDGNSGGPLVDRAGKVVGINTAVAAQSGDPNTGIGLAIPIKMAKSVASQLISKGKVVRGDIGVYVGTVTDELAHSFGFRGSGGALVQDVSSDTAGSRADLQPGDIIVERDGIAVESASDFRNAIANLSPGSSVKLQIFREGKLRSVEVEVSELPAMATVASPAPTVDQMRWGIELTEMTPELAERLQIGSSQGAVIVQVYPNSPADDAGLRVGDLVASVGDTEVKDVEQARRLLLTAKAPMRLRVVHDGRGTFVVLSEPTAQSAARPH